MISFLIGRRNTIIHAIWFHIEYRLCYLCINNIILEDELDFSIYLQQIDD